MSGSFCPVRWFEIGRDHPALPGHFPGQPVVPGVLLLDSLVALIEETAPGMRLASIPVAKFLSPVAPGTTVLLGLDHESEFRARFVCVTSGTLVAQGTFVLVAR